MLEQATTLHNYDSFCKSYFPRDSLGLSQTPSLHTHNASMWCPKSILSSPPKLGHSQNLQPQFSYSNNQFTPVPLGDIFPLSQLHALADLIPRFGAKADPWLSKQMSFAYSTGFWLNRYFDKQTYFALILCLNLALALWIFLYAMWFKFNPKIWHVS